MGYKCMESFCRSQDSLCWFSFVLGNICPQAARVLHSKVLKTELTGSVVFIKAPSVAHVRPQFSFQPELWQFGPASCSAGCCCLLSVHVAWMTTLCFHHNTSCCSGLIRWSESHDLKVTDSLKLTHGDFIFLWQLKHLFFSFSLLYSV